MRFFFKFFSLVIASLSLFFTSALANANHLSSKAIVPNVVAVGYSGNIYTSVDLKTWTQQMSGTRNQLNSVVWGNNQYMVVGDNGTIMFSTDGETWEKQYFPATNERLKGIAWANNQYVVISVNSVFISSNGIDWVQHKITKDADVTLYSIAVGKDSKGNNQFVVAGLSSSMKGVIYTSPDGINWTLRLSTSVPSLFKSVTWINNQFVAVGNGDYSSNYVYSSPNGVDWTGGRISAGSGYEQMTSVTWNKNLNRYYAVTWDYKFTTSANGINWSDLDNFGLVANPNAITQFNNY